MKKLVVLIVMLLSSSAHAVLIDFTSDEWSGVSGDSFTVFVPDVGFVTLDATGGNLTFNENDNSGCLNNDGSSVLACDGDGIGIRNDEITSGSQNLVISFDNPTDVIEIYLLDLFDNSREREVAEITIDGDGSIYTIVGGSDGGGFIITGIMQDDVATLSFEAIGSRSDFAVAGIEVMSVPEPGTLALFGLGLAGLGLARRRRRV